MAVGTGTSLALSSLLSLLLFAGMQMYSRQLASTEWLTIQGGLLGSALFVCSLTVSFARWHRGPGLRRLLVTAPIQSLTPQPGLQQPGEPRLRQGLPGQDIPGDPHLPLAGSLCLRPHSPRLRDHLPHLLHGRPLLHQQDLLHPLPVRSAHRCSRQGHRQRQEEELMSCSPSPGQPPPCRASLGLLAPQ
uniref:Dolichyl-diphosphooligosaccharide--protein glycosyltransferase subunit KCP2 n=1 Tax=Strigops habroptila TaxID=2489341 RepID=A0A672UX77_STRHB